MSDLSYTDADAILDVCLLAYDCEIHLKADVVMPSERSGPRPFDPERYTETDARLRRLESGLSEDAVASMAREVIGRVAHRAHATAAPTGRINALAAALTDPDRNLCREMVEDLLEETQSVETLYLNYLTQAARRLGQLWEDDALSFADVAVGTGRIYALLRALNAPAPSGWADGHPGAFFAVVPGEEHTLGIRMAADLFRRRGWQIDLSLGLDHDATVSTFEEGTHRLVGVSASAPRNIAALGKFLVALRSVRPGIRVLVAGHLANTDRDLVDGLAPDAVANDFESAFENLTALWADMTAEPA